MLSISDVGPPGHGTATTDGHLVTYDSAPEFTGQDIFTYTVQDADGLDDVATVALTVLTETLQVEVGPMSNGILIHADAQHHPTVVEIPAGAVDAPTIIGCTPTVLAEALSTPGVVTEHVFALTASRDGASLPGLAFRGPVTVTIHYSDGLNAPTYDLRQWNGAAWSLDGVNIISTDPAIGRLVAQISQTGQYALFSFTGPGSKLVFLPLVMTWNDGGVR